MKWIDRFKSLPKSTKNLLVVGVLLALVAALPLFIWAITTQKFLISQKAASGEPTPTAVPTPTPTSVYPPQVECGWCGGIANIQCGAGLECKSSYANVVYPEISGASNGICVKPDNSSVCAVPTPVTVFCAKHPPTLSVAPQSQPGAPGSTVTYSYTITNNDHVVPPGTLNATVCQSLSGGRVKTMLPDSNWGSNTTQGIVSAIPPGKQASATFTVTAPSSPAPSFGSHTFGIDYINLPGTQTFASTTASFEVIPGYTATPTATPTPSPYPNSCGGTCGNNYNCTSGLICYNGFCRNPSCTSDLTCGCATGSRSFGILFRFEGVSDGSADGAKVTVKFSNPGWYGASYVTPPLTASHVSGGVYSLRFYLPTSYLPFYSQYSIVLKGEKHAQMKFCQPQGQTIYCTASTVGQINIPNTSDLISFNFTGIPLPAGDTYTQDGRVDDIDYARIFAILSKPSSSQTAEDLLVGDLNYNGRVDGIDMFLLMKTLGTRYDEN